MEFPKPILSFLKSQTLITLATSADNIPYCANCFYSFDLTNKLLIIKSGSSTRHIREGLLNNKVAGAIIPSSLKIGQIIGLQFQGILSEPVGEELIAAKNSYYKKFPFALIMPGELWIIQPEYLKMTDNRKLFAEKTEWKINLLVQHEAHETTA